MSKNCIFVRMTDNIFPVTDPLLETPSPPMTRKLEVIEPPFTAFAPNLLLHSFPPLKSRSFPRGPGRSGSPIADEKLDRL